MTRGAAKIGQGLTQFVVRFGGVWLEWLGRNGLRDVPLAPDIDLVVHGPDAHIYNIMLVLTGICEFDLNDSYESLVVASIGTIVVAEGYHIHEKRKTFWVRRRGGSSNSSYRKDDYNRRYDGDDSEDIMRTSAALYKTLVVTDYSNFRLFVTDVHSNNIYNTYCFFADLSSLAAHILTAVVDIATTGLQF
ncbi:hypothetical protein Tco_0570285 [Tanacetum coccineum]